MPKRLIMIIIYLSSGLILLSLILLTFYSHVLQIKIETAVVNSPLQAIHPIMSGMVKQIFVTPGTKVKKDSPLAIIENISLEKELTSAEINIEEAKLSLNLNKEFLKNEQQRLNFYKKVGESKINSAKASVNIAKLDLIAAEKNLLRMKQLHHQHHLSEAGWDMVNKNYHTAADQLQFMTFQYELENHSLHFLENGLYFTGNKLEGRKQDLLAEISAAEKHLNLEQKKLAMLNNINRKLILTAPLDAKIIQILHTAGNIIDPTHAIFLLEPLQSSKNIIAYLTQDEVTHIKLNSRVKIYIPAVDQTFPGIVTEVNRTAGFIDEINTSYRYRNLYADRTAIVTIEILAKNGVQFSNQVSAGMPAIVSLPRKWH